MKLVVGLGNPGAKYKGTRHNIGFMTMDEVAYQEKFDFDKALFDAVFAQVTIGGEKVIFMKPLTFMNLSGEAIRPLMNYFKIGIEALLVVYDDMDLPVGKIRLRQKGSAGGHNGIKSIISCLGTSEFNRIKVGVGRPKEGRTVVGHVLNRFEKEEEEDIIFAVQKSVDAIRSWIETDDFVKTMNQFHYRVEKGCFEFFRGLFLSLEKGEQYAIIAQNIESIERL